MVGWMRPISTNEAEGIILLEGELRVKKINMTVWGAALLVLGLCLTVAATGESGLVGAALAFASTLAVTVSLWLNVSGLKRSRANSRVMMIVIGFIFTIINLFAYMYALIAGIAKVSFFSNGLTQLLYIFALILPAVLAFILAIKDGMPSTRDRVRR